MTFGSGHLKGGSPERWIPPTELASSLLDEYVATGEGYLLDNADADDLREMLRLARSRLVRAPLPLPAAEEALVDWLR